MREIPKLRIAAASVGLALLITAAARADFTVPAYISQAGEDSFVPQVAVADDGNAIAAWRSFDGTSSQIEARTISAAGVRGPLLALTGTGQDAFHPDVATDAGGDAVAVWRRFKGDSERIQARLISGASVLGPTMTLSSPGQDGLDPAVATNDNGDAVVVWRRSDGSDHRIQARAISAAGALGPTLTLSAAGQNARDPEVAIDANGDAIAIWRRSDGSKVRVQARRVSAAGALGPIQTLSEPQANTIYPRVGVDAEGDAIAAWRAFAGGQTWIEALPISAEGVVGEKILSRPSDPRPDYDLPDLAVNDGGDAVLAFVRPRGLGLVRVLAVTISPSGELVGGFTISADIQTETIPRVAIDASGDAVVVWTRIKGEQEERVHALTISAAGEQGPTEVVSGQGQDDLNHRVAIGGGRAFIVWERSDGTNSRIQVARGP